MPADLQDGLDPVPGPAHITGPMDQRKGSHRPHATHRPKLAVECGVLSGRTASVGAMAALNHDELRRRTLQRQFPSISGRDQAAVLELFGRLGPIQTQVPRAPFLVASSRLPGVAVRRRQRPVRRPQAGQDQLHPRNRAHQHRRRVRPAGPGRPPAPRQPAAHLRRARCRDPGGCLRRAGTPLRRRLGPAATPSSPTSADGSPRSTARCRPPCVSESVIWGHSGLLRRPRDEHWERRTDAFHRTGRSVLPDLEVLPPEAALADLVLGHLGAYGPSPEPTWRTSSESPHARWTAPRPAWR